MDIIVGETTIKIRKDPDKKVLRDIQASMVIKFDCDFTYADVVRYLLVVRVMGEKHTETLVRAHGESRDFGHPVFPQGIVSLLDIALEQNEEDINNTVKQIEERYKDFVDKKYSNSNKKEEKIDEFLDALNNLAKVQWFYV